MRITPFAGLTVLSPGEPFSTDGYSFQDRNPDLTDRLLRVGAVTHRHDEHPPLGNPAAAPSATALASGGSFPADADARFGYTLLDLYGGESLVSPLAEVTTAGAVPDPDGPVASADYAAGGLLAGSYSYVKTWTDGSGGETRSSIETIVAVDPGHASARVRFTGLSTGMTAVGANGWRLYKSANGSDFHFIAAGSGATLDDAGQLCADCVDRPPFDNTTQNHNLVQLRMPAIGALPSAAVSFRLYGSIGVGFTSPAFFGQYPLASAGATFNFAGFNPGDGSPPPISTTVPGASKINFATEVIGFVASGGGGGGGAVTWREPVANSGALPPQPVEFRGSGLPHAIPDAALTPEQEVPIVVTAASGVLVDQVAVELQITHSYVGDLRLWLRHPDGTRISLINSQPGSSQDIGTTGSSPPDAGFADSGSSLASFFGAPIVGTFAPIEPLSTFTGKPASGTWKLLAVDDAGGDVGTINDVRLVFNNIIGASPTAGDARATLNDNSVYLRGLDNAWHRVGGPPQVLSWANISAVGSLASGWSNTQTFGDAGTATWASAGIAKDPQGVVHMRGMLTKASALSLPENIARLPVGFRPPFRKRFTVPAYDPVVGHPFMLLVDILGLLDTGNEGQISLRRVLPYDDPAASSGTGPQLTFDGISFET